MKPFRVATGHKIAPSLGGQTLFNLKNNTMKK